MVRTLVLWLLLTAAAAQLAHAEIGVRASLSNAAPWVREEVLLTVEVIDDRSILEQKVMPWTPHGVALRPLPGQQERLKTESGVLILHRHRWALMPLYPGAMSLQPPSIEVRAQDQGHVTLTPPPLALQVRPLDPLLPGDVPVGALKIEMAALPRDVARDQPFEVMLTIEGYGLSARGIGRWLEEGLRDSGALRVYPPQIRLVNDIDPAQPLRQRVEARLSFAARDHGKARLPALRLPYVDPADAGLGHAVLPATELHVVHPLWRALRPWLPWIAGLGAAAGAMLAVFGFARPRWTRARRRRAWLKALHAAESPEALRAAWRMEARTSARDTADSQALTPRLDAACYGPNRPDKAEFAALKAALIDAATRSRR